MWFEKLLNIVGSLLPSNPTAGIEKELIRLNPDKVYTENVRSLLNISQKRAEKICEQAVRQGLFTRHIEVLCPDGSVATSAQTLQDLPKKVTCWHESNDDFDELEYNIEDLRKTYYYSLNNENAAILQS